MTLYNYLSTFFSCFTTGQEIETFQGQEVLRVTPRLACSHVVLKSVSNQHVWTHVRTSCSFETLMHLCAVDCLLLKVGTFAVPLCPRFARQTVTLVHGFKFWFWLICRPICAKAFKRKLETAMVVGYVRTDGFHIILKQHRPLLKLHEAMNKGRLSDPVSCKLNVNPEWSM